MNDGEKCETMKIIQSIAYFIEITTTVETELNHPTYPTRLTRYQKKHTIITVEQELYIYTSVFT